MHGFAHVVASILTYAWASGLVAKCQRVVSLFRHSHTARERLSAKAQALQITSGLVSADTTRTSVQLITSVQRMLQSVAALRPALTQARLQKQIGLYDEAEVCRSHLSSPSCQRRSRRKALPTSARLWQRRCTARHSGATSSCSTPCWRPSAPLSWPCRRTTPRSPTRPATGCTWARSCSGRSLGCPLVRAPPSFH